MSKKREAPPKPEELIQKLSERLDVVKLNLNRNYVFNGFGLITATPCLRSRPYKIALSAVQLHTVAMFLRQSLNQGLILVSVLPFQLALISLPACTYLFSGEK